MNLINLNANLIFYIYSPTIIHYLTINLTLLSYSTNNNWIKIMLWKLLAADIECVEGIGAVGAVFEKILFDVM